jgi:hypothetical protein
VPGFGAKQLNYAALNANSVAVLIGDIVVAFAQTASYSFGFGTEAYYGIGSAMPQEIQQLRVGPDISIDSIVLTAAGTTLLQGGTDISTLLANNAVDLHVTSGTTNPQVLFTYVGCVASNFSESVSANRPVTRTISFMALDVLSKDGTSILNSGSAFTVTSAVAGGSAALGLVTS